MRIGSTANIYNIANAVNNKISRNQPQSRNDREGEKRVDNNNKLNKNNGGRNSFINSKMSNSANEMIQKLTERKQSIVDMKNQYVEKALADGVEDKVITAKVEEYQKMLSDVDVMISDVLKNEAEKNVSNQNETGGQNIRKPENAVEEQLQKNSVISENLMNTFTSVENNKVRIESVQNAKHTLIREATGYMYSDGGEYAEMVNSAERLDGEVVKINGENMEIIEESKKDLDTKDKEDQDKKTQQQLAVESFKQTNEMSITSANLVDVQLNIVV